MVAFFPWVVAYRFLYFFSGKRKVDSSTEKVSNFFENTNYTIIFNPLNVK